MRGRGCGRYTGRDPGVAEYNAVFQKGIEQ